MNTILKEKLVNLIQATKNNFLIKKVCSKSIRITSCVQGEIFQQNIFIFTDFLRILNNYYI